VAADLELEPLPPAFYRRPAEEVAPDLLGRFLVRRSTDDDGGRAGASYLSIARLVETEAYLGAADRASHASGGRRTRRNASLYLPGGHWYVYFVYGMHWCLNAVCGEADEGGAVLLRAAEPVAGEPAMRALRGLDGAAVRPGDVAGGPGKLCQAFGVDRRFDGVPLGGGELWIARGEAIPAARVARGPRIGVAYAGEAASWPLRFAEAGNRHVSRPRL
jgi:DNA-3-methyladenine glycosylase